MPETLNSSLLTEIVGGSAAAFRCRRRLQPAGGPGDKVFPPTFKGAVYSVEQRHIPGCQIPSQCVLLDSVQSQANRMELALQEALNDGDIRIPIVEVDFTEYAPTGDIEEDAKKGRLLDAIGKVTSLQTPHRLADAILRDSQLNDIDFRKSDIGKPVNTASANNATPIFALCPTALVFGMWDSTGPKGGLGAKFERAIVSEIIGVGAQVGDLLRGVRRDPLDIRAAVKVVKEDSSYRVAGPNDKGAVNPSKVNHSNVLFPENWREKREDNRYAGVTIAYAEQTTTLSLICLRGLHFPIEGQVSLKVDLAARAALTALGLCAAVLAFESGVDLRSRCLLWPGGPMEWELLCKPGEPVRTFAITREQAISLLNESIKAALEQGLPWHREPIMLKPSPRLLELVRSSQLAAVGETPDASQST
jgi:CRISPR-associated protein Csb1